MSCISPAYFIHLVHYSDTQPWLDKRPTGPSSRCYIVSCCADTAPELSYCRQVYLSVAEVKSVCLRPIGLPFSILVAWYRRDVNPLIDGYSPGDSESWPPYWPGRGIKGSMNPQEYEVSNFQRHSTSLRSPTLYSSYSFTMRLTAAFLAFGAAISGVTADSITIKICNDINLLGTCITPSIGIQHDCRS